MKTILGILLITFGGVFGLSRIMSWIGWTIDGQWSDYTRGGTCLGILRLLWMETVFAVFWGGFIYLGLRLVQ